MFKEPFDANNWTGRIDFEDGELGIRLHQIVENYDNQSNVNVISGFCSDEGVKRNNGRLGSASAPNFIRKMLANLPRYNQDLKLYDDGNLIVDSFLEESNQLQIERLKYLLEKNCLPIIIGGGHETALSSFLGYISKYPKNSIVINIDAHFDIRKPNIISTSGTPFYEMYEYCKKSNLNFNYLTIGIQESGNTNALFQRAEELNINYILADELHANFNRVLDDIKHVVSQFDHIYLSLDMDVFDLSYAPGVSATTVNGLTPFQVKYLIKFLKKSNKVRVFDIVETNPLFDRDNQTAKLAANMIFEILKN